MARTLLLLVPVFLAGIIVGAVSLNDNPTTASDTTPQSYADGSQAVDYQRLQKMLDALTDTLNFEVAERRRLEDELNDLRSVVESQVAATASTDPTSRQAAVPGVSDRRRPTRSDTSSEQRFVQAGIAPEVATQLKQQMDQLEMQRLYLRDQAMREGWLGSARYRKEMVALADQQNSVRDQLSPEDYARFLYALGRPNSVSVNSVLSGSPADQAGLQSGDRIVSYNGERIFSPNEVRQATAGGTMGEMIAVEVRRNGQDLVVYVPRGPLGVQMGASVAQPEK